MSKIGSFFRFVGHYKYLIVIVVGVISVVFVGNSSYLNILSLKQRKAELQREVKVEKDKDLAAKKELQEIREHPKSIEHVARETHGMKHEDEDIFVLHSELKKAGK